MSPADRPSFESPRSTRSVLRYDIAVLRHLSESISETEIPSKLPRVCKFCGAEDRVPYYCTGSYRSYSMIPYNRTVP